MKYDNFNISKIYDKSRAFPPETLKLWMNSINGSVPDSEVSGILDLGCGTGRFTKALAGYFKAEITGVDLSEKMLKEASAKMPEFDFRKGSAEDIPCPDGSFDLVFMSMVYHHIENRDKAMQEITRVLKAGKYFCLRNSAIESMYDVLYLKYFPSAIELNKKRLSKRDEITGTAEKAGLVPVNHQVISQKFTGDFKEYCDKISMRGLSDLALIPDDEFKEGLEKMKLDIKKHPGPVYEPVELFIFRKT